MNLTATDNALIVQYLKTSIESVFAIKGHTTKKGAF